MKQQPVWPRFDEQKVASEFPFPLAKIEINSGHETYIDGKVIPKVPFWTSSSPKGQTEAETNELEVHSPKIHTFLNFLV